MSLWINRAARLGLDLLALLVLLAPAVDGATPSLGPISSPTNGPSTSSPVTAAASAAAIVRAVDVMGNAHVPASAILAAIRTKVGDPFDPRLVTDDLHAINDLGYFADQAPPIIKQRPDGISVTFRVVENPVVTSINFRGDRTVSADILAALMDTTTGKVFDLKLYQEDVLKINAYYDRIGFGGQVPSHVTDVNIDASGKLVLYIQEGLTVRHIVIVPPPEADPELSVRLIMNALVTKEGNVYSEARRDKDVDQLKRLYKEHDLTIGDFEAGIDPASIDLKSGTADVRYAISVARVGAVEITGDTVTHDDVIRRQLRLKPGMLVTDSAVHYDYNRINNLGFFERVDVTSNPGPDPKRPAYVTLKWSVKEQRTGVAQVGAGYSGGATGTGLTGNLSYSKNDINGTGNSASIRLERGSQTADASLSFTVPYLGTTEKSNKYSLNATIFTQAQTNYYPVYQNTPAPAAGVTSTPIPSGDPIPVSLVPASSNYVEESDVYATYKTAAKGVTATLGQVQSSVTVQSPYYFPTSQSSSYLTTSSSSSSTSTAIGVSSASIANVTTTSPYPLHSFVLGIGADTRDDVQNPRSGSSAALTDEISSPAIGSAFQYSQYTLNVARFFPVLKRSTLAMHVRYGITTGAIPTTKLYTFSDQDLRAYTNVYYGTDMALAQAELRYPLTADRKLSIVFFGDDGATRIVGGTQINSDSSTTDLNSYTWHPDVGIGVRFDIPQLGLRTLRLDFAKGSLGTHLSFGIGQAF
jgi:outer membrane protein assembly factor BamA